MDGVSISRRATVATMAALMTSLLLAALDSTIVSTAMPRIIGEMGGMANYSWPFTAYMLTSTVSILLFGKVSDLVGRKRVLLAGIVTFLAGSVACGASQSMAWLIASRCLQGIGGGIITSSSFIVVGLLFPPRERAKYISYLVAMYGLASVIGPAVGGFITDLLDWRWVFLVNLPLGAVAFFLVLFFAPPLKANPVRKKVDFAGAFFLVAAVVPLLLAFTWLGAGAAWSEPRVLASLGLSALGSAALVYFERRAEDPIISPLLFGNRVFNLSFIALILGSSVLFCGIVYIPLFAQGGLGMSASGSGAVATPMMVGLTGATILCGQVISRTGRYKALALAGFSLCALGFMLLLLSMAGVLLPGVVYLQALLIGFGAGLVIPVFNISAQLQFHQSNYGVVASTLQFTRNLGATLGTSFFGSLFTWNMDHGRAALQKPQLAPNLLEALSNPRFLGNRAAIAGLMDKLKPVERMALEGYVDASRECLVGSIKLVFAAGISISLAALAVSLLMKEEPIRRPETA